MKHTRSKVVWVPLEQMTPADVAYTVKRLRRRGEHEHADELETYWAVRRECLRRNLSEPALTTVLLEAKHPLNWDEARRDPAAVVERLLASGVI